MFQYDCTDRTGSSTIPGRTSRVGSRRQPLHTMNAVPTLFAIFPGKSSFFSDLDPSENPRCIFPFSVLSASSFSPFRLVYYHFDAG
jgi:hypothetical protein